MNAQRQQFIHNEILTSTISGGLGRGYPVYKKNVRDKDKTAFRSLLRRKLVKYGRLYRNKKVSVSEEKHINNIARLTKEISETKSEILNDNEFKIGRSQKLLNLYLKYLWTLGWIVAEPPHCPFDSKIIGKLNLAISWTKLNNTQEYKYLVDHAKKAAGHSSLANWELRQWNK